MTRPGLTKSNSMAGMYGVPIADVLDECIQQQGNAHGVAVLAGVRARVGACSPGCESLADYRPNTMYGTLISSWSGTTSGCWR